MYLLEELQSIVSLRQAQIDYSIYTNQLILGRISFKSLFCGKRKH